MEKKREKEKKTEMKMFKGGEDAGHICNPWIKRQRLRDQEFMARLATLSGLHGTGLQNKYTKTEQCYNLVNLCGLDTRCFRFEIA